MPTSQNIEINLNNEKELMASMQYLFNFLNYSNKIFISKLFVTVLDLYQDSEKPHIETNIIPNWWHTDKSIYPTPNSPEALKPINDTEAPKPINDTEAHEYTFNDLVAMVLKAMEKGSLSNMQVNQKIEEICGCKNLPELNNHPEHLSAVANLFKGYL